MKKIIVSLFCLAGAALVITSCGSTKKLATVATINGEWDIVEINGTAVVPPAGMAHPSIGFDSTTGNIYGNSGCNRMMGSFNASANPGTIDLGNIASTRMACPDMTLEQNVLNTLKNVRGYRKLSNNRVALTNSMNRPVVVLEPKAALSIISSLDGEWKITEVNGEVVPGGLEKQPFISFDTTQKRVHGNAGCNTVNGGFTTDINNTKAIAFPAMAATMMACPDMTWNAK